MAYAALLSLAQVLHQTLNRDYQYLILDERQQIESLVEIITSIQKDFSSQKKIQVDEKREIRVAAYIVEDIIESRIIERFRTESAGNEDGSTEKKLVRFNVLEDWIIASSKSAPSRRSRHEIGLEIVGVGGVEKPITFQNIDGIRQLARTFRFKAWFLHSDVLLHDASPYASPYGTRFLHSDVLHDDASPYSTRSLHSDVLHDDASPYSNAIWTLKRWANHGTEIVIIDTYSMGTSATMEELSSFGFDTSLFVGAITSEDLRALVANRADDAWFEEPEPSNIDITSGAVYGSRRAMADVDADRCIVVTRDLRDIKAANAVGFSTIFLADYRYHEFEDRDLDTGHDAHPTYVLPSFTW